LKTDQHKTIQYDEELNYNIAPPTKIPTNEFTWIFQEIVNTYGIARYREINPGLYTIISFPFLFGMMFGDMGHGMLLLIFAIWLLNVSPKTVKELEIGILYKCRYIVILMAIFSVYFGVLYNEFFAISVPLHPSCYDSTSGD
jgi:V-type H+-transporting ATPase subunit a